MTFIGEFYKYCRTRSDCPPDFFVHGAMAALGYAMGSNVCCLDGWSRPIYPNLWIAIIARSGMGKSIPLDMSQDLIKKSGLGDGIFPESFSQEALFVHMDKHPTGIFYIQEFSAFMGAIHRDYNCVDVDTEILTRDGWKTHDTLEVGDEVLAAEAKGYFPYLKWKTVKNIHRYNVVNEELLDFTGHTVSMRVTKNHKLVNGICEKFYADDVPENARMLQTARWAGGFGRECSNKHLAALIGWYVAEGWNDGKHIRIAQKTHTEQLVTALNGYKTKGRHGRTTVDITEQSERRGMRWFTIKGKTVENIKYWAPDKQFRWDILWRWPKTSIKALFDALMQADGHQSWVENDTRTRHHQGEGTFTQLDKQRGDFFQALCIRLGYRATRWTHPTLGWSHYSVSNARTAPVPKATPVKYTGIVWCPETESGTWVARRAGRVFVTGNSGTEQFLTKIYDVPELEQRITMKKDQPLVTLYRPCVNILAASSPDWFAESFKASSLRGGFLARFMFCPSNDPGDYVGLPGPRDESIESGLAGHLREASLLSGKMDFSNVKTKFTEWDRLNRQELRANYSADFGGMRSRAGLMVLKASMIFSASRDPSSMVITDTDLDQAIRYVERTHAMAEAYLSEEVAGDKWEAQRIKVLEVVRSHNGHIPWSEALRLSRLSRREFDSAVDTLCQSGRLIIEPGVSRQRYLRLPEEHRPLPEGPR